MGTADTMIAVLGAGLVGLWLYSSGALNQFLGGQQQPQQLQQQQIPLEVYKKEKEDEDDDEEEEDEDDERRKEQPFFPEEQLYGPQVQPQYQYQGPAPPPGMQSSLIPMVTPSGPPYTSQTVRTYSPYSPYNQFRAYQPYQTYPQLSMGLTPDDNVNFSDISTTSRQCRYCKSRCSGNPASLTCLQCRPACKSVVYTQTPSMLGWDIKPVGTVPTNYSPYTAGLGMVFDYLAGNRKRQGAVFTDMDDYNQKRRFDPHNKLRRRIHEGPNHPYVSYEDYWDKQRFAFNIE